MIMISKLLILVIVTLLINIIKSYEQIDYNTNYTNLLVVEGNIKVLGISACLAPDTKNLCDQMISTTLTNTLNDLTINQYENLVIGSDIIISIRNTTETDVAIVNFKLYINSNNEDVDELLSVVTNQLIDITENNIITSEISYKLNINNIFIPKTSLIIKSNYILTDQSLPHYLSNYATDFSENLLKLIFLGDWGKGGLIGDITKKSNSYLRKALANNEISFTYQASIGRSINSYISTSSAVSGIVALGDNFYNDGVNSIYDSQWNKSWASVYSGPAMLLPWYAVLGNHDYGYGTTGVNAQINHDVNNMNDPNNVWHMPSTNYRQRFNLNDNGILDVIFIDTTTLAPNECKNCNKQTSDSDKTQIRSDQLNTIEDLLIESSITEPTADWIVVAGHYPIYSSGEHGDLSELVQYLNPLLIKYQVDIYISGHDHISEHLYSNSIHYFVSGAGAMADSLGKSKSVADLIWSGTGYSAFSVMSISKNYLSIDYIDINGEYKYNYILRNYKSTNLESSNVNTSNYINSRFLVIPSYFLYGLIVLAGIFIVISTWKRMRSSSHTSDNSNNHNLENSKKIEKRAVFQSPFGSLKFNKDVSISSGITTKEDDHEIESDPTSNDKKFHEKLMESINKNIISNNKYKPLDSNEMIMQSHHMINNDRTDA